MITITSITDVVSLLLTQGTISLVQAPGIFPQAPSHWSRRPVYSLRHRLIGPGARYIPSGTVSLVQAPGIFPQAPSNWSRRPVYSLRHRHILIENTGKHVVQQFVQFVCAVRCLIPRWAAERTTPSFLLQYYDY
jgi:hypothetical protein